MQGARCRAVIPSWMLPAHHRSAYRFLADRHPRWWQPPLRVILMLAATCGSLEAGPRARHLDRRQLARTPIEADDY